MILSVDCNKDLVLSYAVFDNETKRLKTYGIEHLKSYSMPQLLCEIYDHIGRLVKEHNVGIVCMKEQDLSRNNKRDLSIESKMIGVISVATVKTKAFFQQLQTNGWFLKITKGKSTYHRKLRLLKNVGIEIKESENLKVDERVLVDTILVGEAYVNNKLQIGV